MFVLFVTSHYNYHDQRSESQIINLLFCLDRRLSFQPQPTAGTPGPTPASTTAATATTATATK